jgi:hypothetical protein
VSVEVERDEVRIGLLTNRNDFVAKAREIVGVPTL